MVALTTIYLEQCITLNNTLATLVIQACFKTLYRLSKVVINRAETSMKTTWSDNTSRCTTREVTAHQPAQAQWEVQLQCKP